MLDDNGAAIRRASIDDVDELVRLRGATFVALDTVDDGTGCMPTVRWFREALAEPAGSRVPRLTPTVLQPASH